MTFQAGPNCGLRRLGLSKKTKLRRMCCNGLGIAQLCFRFYRRQLSIFLGCQERFLLSLLVHLCIVCQNQVHFRSVRQYLYFLHQRRDAAFESSWLRDTMLSCCQNEMHALVRYITMSRTALGVYAYRLAALHRGLCRANRRRCILGRGSTFCSIRLRPSD